MNRQVKNGTGTASALRMANRRVGLLLAAFAFGMCVYSFMVIKTRGHIPEPPVLSKKEKILRGL